MVTSRRPRNWTAVEVVLVREAAERAWAAARRTLEAQRRAARAEQALRASEEMFRHTVEAVPQSVWVSDPGGEVRFVNRYWTEQTGLDLDATRDRERLAAAIHPEDRDDLFRQWETCLGTGERFEREVRLARRDGEYRWFLIRALPVRDASGQVTRWYGVGVDVHDLRRAEQEAAAARAAAERGRDRMARLQALTAALSEALRPEQVLLLTAREVAGVLEADGWCVTLVEPGSTPVMVSCEHLTEAARHLIERDQQPYAARAETTWLTTRAELEASSPGLTLAEPSLKSALVIRLGEPTGARGVLVLSFVSETQPGAADRDLVTTAARLAADALVRASAYAVEHRAAVVLQESLLSGPVPRLPGARLCVRYRPAAPQYRLGGDWYDATALDDHTIGMSVGDVVGSGLEAATAMGRLRAAAVTLAVDGAAPGDLLRRLERVCQAIPGSELATLAYAALDTRRGAVRFACAGHPPPLVVAPAGGTRYLWDGRSVPLGVVGDAQRRPEGTAVLPPGSRFVLYSDGLVEQPRRSITAGLERLAKVASAAVMSSLDRFCDTLETALLDAPQRDDVAILCVELDRPDRDVLEIHRPARARELAGVRASLRAWLGEHGVTERDQRRLLLACGEACANVVEHAYGATEAGKLSVWLARDESVGVTARVQDSGRWREPSAEGLRGRGSRIMRGSVDRVEVSSTSLGTEVCLQLAL